MKNNYFFRALIVLAALLPSGAAFAQSTYTWSGTNSLAASWNASGSWTPARTTPAVNDILVFDGSTRPNPIATYDAASPHTIGQFRVINGAQLTMIPTVPGVNLQIGAGIAGADLDIQAGTTLTVSTISMYFTVTGTNTASISGAVSLNGLGAGALRGTAAGSVVFNSGSSFTAAAGVTDYPLGTGGTANTVVFASGSTLTHVGCTFSFFGSGTNKVQLQTGSTVVVNSAVGMEYTDRTFGNITIGSGLNIVVPVAFGSTTFNLDNLHVSTGSTFNYTANGNGGLTVNGNITSAGTGTVVLGPGSSGTLTLKGGISTTGTGNVTINGGGGPGAVILNSGATQTIGGGGGTGTITFDKMTVSSSTTVVLTRNVVLNGLASINGGSTINFGVRSFTGSGSFTLASNATLITASNSGINTSGATGSVQVSGTRTYSSGATYEFQGTAMGNFIPATTPAANEVFTLRINSPGISLPNPLRVAGQLVMMAGILTIGNNNLTVIGAIPETNLSSTCYVQTNGTAGLTRSVEASPVLFPVGNSAYNPARLQGNIVAGHLADDYTVRCGDAVFLNGVSGALSPDFHVNRTWYITELAAGGTNMTLTLQWNGGEPTGGFSNDHVFIAHHTGAKWESMGVNPATAPAASGSNPFTASKAGMTTLSPFTVASPGFGPLPIRLENIGATNNGKVNIVSWKTAHEDAGDYMILERSADANLFVPMATIHGEGSGSNYSYTDQQPVAGINYYRLKMMDVAGNATYSQVVTATAKGTTSIVLFPNPATDKLQIIVNSNEGELTVTDMSGKLHYNMKVSAMGNQVDMSALPSGLYFVKYTNGTLSELHTVVKK